MNRSCPREEIVFWHMLAVCTLPSIPSHHASYTCWLPLQCKQQRRMHAFFSRSLSPRYPRPGPFFLCNIHLHNILQHSLPHSILVSLPFFIVCGRSMHLTFPLLQLEGVLQLEEERNWFPSPYLSSSSLFSPHRSITASHRQELGCST